MLIQARKLRMLLAWRNFNSLFFFVPLVRIVQNKRFHSMANERFIRVIRQPMSESGWDLLEFPSERTIKSLVSPDGWPWGSAFSTDNTRFATASYDETVRIWDAVDGTALTTLKPTPKAWCRAVSFSIDDNDLLITRFHDVVLYHRQWSERWWGYFFRFEFCLFVVVSVAFLWSIYRDCWLGGWRRYDAERIRAAPSQPIAEDVESKGPTD